METIEEAWRHLRIFKEEDEIVTVEDIDEAWQTDRIWLYLVSKLLTNKRVNSSSMKTTFSQAWRIETELPVGVLSNNRFVFQFFVIWVWFLGIPLGQRSEGVFKAIGTKHGGLLAIDDESPLLLGEEIRIRVNLNVKNPLLRGMAISVEGKKIWLGIQYERLPCFCYSCGRLGHAAKECSDEKAKEKSKEVVQYGVWLRAPKTKRRGRLFTAEKEKEANWGGRLKKKTFINAKPEEFNLSAFGFSKVHACTNEKNEAQRCQNINQNGKGGALPNRKKQIANPKVHACTKAAEEEIPLANSYDPMNVESETITSPLAPLNDERSKANSAKGKVDQGMEKTPELLKTWIQVAQTNTPTAHALRAWAWSSGRAGGFGLPSTRVT